MKCLALHSWRLTPKQAAALQLELRGRIVLRDDFGPIRLVAGADVAVRESRKAARAWGAVVVFEFPSLELVERRWSAGRVSFPYVPGLLSFRELPILVRAFRKLKAEPDLVLFDGQGYAHPRRMGLACHAGLLLDRPTIGCAKSRLLGEGTAPAKEAGSWAPLKDGGEVVGATVRTRTGVKPIYVSPGHRISPATAVALVLRCCDGTRIPKPTREAHRFVESLKRAVP